MNQWAQSNGEQFGFPNVLWWTVYIICGIWAQHLLPGVDFFLPGMVVSMQENSGKQTLWLAGVFILIQEGAGLMAFGSSILWYGAAAICFHLGRWLFEAENLLFILLLSCVMGAWHVGLSCIMSMLQNVAILPERLIIEGGISALVIPLAWIVVRYLRTRFLQRVNAS